MRLSAYLLAGDPAWIAQSVSSYYPHVDRIIVSFDRDHRSWSGQPLSVAASLARLEAVDPDGKVVLLPGDHADPSRRATDVETEQRQAALDVASDGADWVIQLDSDEIINSPAVFMRFVSVAESHGASSLDFPSRWFYARSPSGVFLEACGRWWTSLATYPGPLAVRAGTRLTHARQAGTTPLYRVDFAPWNTDPAHPATAPVHATIRPRDAVTHLSWVRTPEQMAEKRVVSGYAASRDWDVAITRWSWRSRHPLLTTLAAPFTQDSTQRFRRASLHAFRDITP